MSVELFAKIVDPQILSVPIVFRSLAPNKW